MITINLAHLPPHRLFVEGVQGRALFIFSNLKSTIQYIRKLDDVLTSEMLTLKQITMINRHVCIFLCYATKLLLVLK